MMRIDNNHNIRIANKTIPMRSQQTHPVQNTQSNSPRPNLREMTGALEIMQKAQIIVQQALTVSSRLQNIAAESFRNGDVDYKQIGNELAQIQESFSTLAPSIPTAAPQMTSVYNNTEKDIFSLKKIAENETIDKSLINSTYSSLQESSYILNRETETIENKMGAVSHPDKKIIAESIMNKPDSSVFAQGNISPESVKRLL
jgi:hypothetical protein